MDWNYCHTINFQSHYLVRYTWPEIRQDQQIPVMPNTTKVSQVGKVRPKSLKKEENLDILFSNTPVIRKHRVLPNRTNEKKLIKWLVKKDKA